MRRLAVRHLPISAPGAQGEPIWRLLVGIHVRLFGGMAPGGTKQERRSDRMVKSPFCGADEARARASAGISRYPRYPPPPRRLPPRGAGIARSRRSQNKKRSLAGWLNSVSAVRTRLELATPGVTGRYSKPTELPHQLSVNFPFGIAKVQLKFDSANILKDFNEKKVRPRRVGLFQRVCGRGRSLEREGCFTSTGRFTGP